MVTTAEKLKMRKASTVVGALVAILMLVVTTAAVASNTANLETGLDSSGEPTGSVVFSTDTAAQIDDVRAPAFRSFGCGPDLITDLDSFGFGPVSIGDGQGMTFQQNTAQSICPAGGNRLVFDTGITVGQALDLGMESFSVSYSDDNIGIGNLTFVCCFFLPDSGIGDGLPVTGQGQSIFSLRSSHLLQEDSFHNSTLNFGEISFAGIFPDWHIGFILNGFNGLVGGAMPPVGTFYEVDFTLHGQNPNLTIMSPDLFDILGPVQFNVILGWTAAILGTLSFYWLLPLTTFGWPTTKKKGRKS